MRRLIIVAAAALTLAVSCAKKEAPQTAGGKSDGAAVFAMRCAMCHGETGKGDTPMASGYPGANLTDGQWVRGGSPAEIEATIRSGIPETPMRAYAGLLTDDEIKAVAAYVGTLSK